MTKHKNIVESKSTSRDVKDIARKAAAWTSLTSDFNAGTVGGKRTYDELKKKWENLKADAKSESTKRRKFITKTGGGTIEPGALKSDEILSSVEDIIKGAMYPVKSNFDSDSDTGCRISYASSDISFDTPNEGVITSVNEQPSSSCITHIVKETEEKETEEKETGEKETEEKETEDDSSIHEVVAPSGVINAPTPKLYTFTTPNKKLTKRDEQSLATASFNRRAEELHEAKMGLLALAQSQMTDRHERFMDLLNNHSTSRDSYSHIGAGGPSWRESLELADTHSVTDTLDVITELV